MARTAGLVILAAVAVAHAVQDTAQFLKVEDIPAEGGGDPNARGKPNVMQQVPVIGEQFAVNPVSTTMKCVISLTIQYMLVYTALALCRTAADSFGLAYDKLPIQKILVTATITVNYAPMLAVLFLGCRMRVLQLTKGKGNPPEWVQMCMYFCTYAVLCMTLIVVVIPLFTGEVIGVDPKTGDIPEDTQPFKSMICAAAFTALKFLIMIGLYGGALAVVYGIVTYEPPAGTWPEGKEFSVSPAVQCTMILSCMFFAVYGLIQVSRTWTQFTGQKLSKFENAMMTSTNCMNFAPMLAILFIGARMRALQMDPVNGNPQKWAQNCFFMCTYATAAQTCLAIAIPLVLQGEVKVGKTEGDMEYTVENKLLGTVLTIGRYAIMLCIYVGFTCVIWSIFTIEHPAGPQYTPAISVTMQCVINLTVQFFFVYGMIWACITLKEFTGFEWALLTQTMENAKGTCQLCPMLAILFVGTRMRALQITQNRGAPQGWVQDGMYMATWSLLIQFCMIAVTPLATGQPAEVDEDGNIKWEPSNKILFYCVQTIRWLGFVLLYAGIITVIVGVYTMTPETANGRGSVPLFGDGKIPVADAKIPGYDGVKEPYGPNDLPMVPTF